MSVSKHVAINFYTKIELRSQYPKHWSWTIRNAVTDGVCEISSKMFSSGDDAWRDSQKAFARFTPPLMAVAA